MPGDGGPQSDWSCPYTGSTTAIDARSLGGRAVTDVCTAAIPRFGRPVGANRDGGPPYVAHLGSHQGALSLPRRVSVDRVGSPEGVGPGGAAAEPEHPAHRRAPVPAPREGSAIAFVPGAVT